jgi:HlyD family secretion protein
VAEVNKSLTVSVAMRSSTAEVTTEASAPLEKGSTVVGPPPTPSPDRYLRLLLTFLTIALVVGGVLFTGLRNRRKSANKPSSASTASINLRSGLRLKGTTEAVRMRAILTPVLSGQFVATLTLTKLTPSGTNVKQGDVIAEFDRQAQIRDFIDKQADHDKLADQVVGEQAKENAARAKDETEIKQAEGRLSKAQLEMQKAEIMSRIDAEKARQELEESEATLAQLRETFALKRKAAHASIHTLEIQRDRTQQIMLHAHADAELLQIRAPLDGIVVLNIIWKEGRMGEVEEGDQLHPGIPFMQVVDPSSMEVRVLANQADFLRLRVGQAARMHLDAYPELIFPAKLEEMAPIGRSGDFSSRLRTFTVLFSVEGSDSKLMPDLSAAVDVDLGAQPHVPEVPE